MNSFASRTPNPASTMDAPITPDMLVIGPGDRSRGTSSTLGVSVSTPAARIGGDGFTHYKTTASVTIADAEPVAIAALEDFAYDAITVDDEVNNVRYLNKYFEAVNQKLVFGGRFTGWAETAAQRQRRIRSRYPVTIARALCALDFAFNRVGPKLKLTRSAYFALRGHRSRVLTEPEVLGRLVSCGFQIVEREEIGGRLRFVVEKVEEPHFPQNPSYGPLFTMRRVGKDGQFIDVYKLRTMHPFSEYLQGYVHETHSLDDSGKFKDDFRITSWGQVMRKLWIDEVPMLANWLRGDLKLVGVRPISAHYLSLYPEGVQERRKRHKPGLIPPFYADLPSGFDAVVESEVRYMEAYERHPHLTDLRYFGRALYNIFVRRARSK